MPHHTGSQVLLTPGRVCAAFPKGSGAGTICCSVTDGTKVFGVSYSHVYADEHLAAIGDAVIQPGTFDGGSRPADDIGTLAQLQDTCRNDY